MLEAARFGAPLVLLLLAGCAPDGVVQDFSLVDVNPTSPTYDSAVSPRDHLERVSGWYFGHAT